MWPHPPVAAHKWISHWPLYAWAVYLWPKEVDAPDAFTVATVRVDPLDPVQLLWEPHGHPLRWSLLESP